MSAAERASSAEQANGRAVRAKERAKERMAQCSLSRIHSHSSHCARRLTEINFGLIGGSEKRRQGDVRRWIEEHDVSVETSVDEGVGVFAEYLWLIQLLTVARL